MKYVKPDVTVMEFATFERLANIDPVNLGGDRDPLFGSAFEILDPDEGVVTRDPNLQ